MKLQLALVFALLVCSQALTLSESAGSLYNINGWRFSDMLNRMKATSFSDNKNTLLRAYLSTYAFTCRDVLTLISYYSWDEEKLTGLTILKNNIVDIENKAVVIDSFRSSDSKNQAAAILNSVFSCQTQGMAPDRFPTITLPYKDQWSSVDIEALVRAINRENWPDRKLQVAENALTATSRVLTSEQACLLYESFTFSSDMLALTEFVKDRIIGLTCDQVKSVLSRFSFQSDQLNALAAFKQNIIDIENKLTLVDMFSSSSFQDKALTILQGAKPKSYLFGIPTGKVVFLIDVSVSMSTSFFLSTGGMSNRLDFVRKEFIKTISNFSPSTEFTVFSYSSNVTAWNTTLQKATQANIISAINFSKNFTANGGTNIYDALQAAWAVPGVQSVYLLTDGTPSVGVMDSDRIIADVKAWNSRLGVKLNTIAFLMGSEGYDDKPNSRKLMSALADATNGIYRALESDK